MNNKLTLTTLTSLAVLAGAVNAQLFDLVNTDDMNLSHTTSAPLTPPGNIALGNGTFTYGTLATDTSGNTAVFSSGAFTSTDWGGQGTFTSTSIDVSSLSKVSIFAQFDGEFNTGSEFSYFFYQLDLDPVVTFGNGAEDVTYTDEVVSISSLDVSAANTLVVGFEFSHNGSGDFFNVDSLTVVPEPGTFSLIAGMLGFTWVMLRRRA